jgi:glycosyltransferase involved in cell wall biosynthesis
VADSAFGFSWRLQQIGKVRISFIVPAFNEERLIGDTLRSIQSALAPFAKRQWETELIVCDNNSTDRTAEIARAAGAKVVFEPVNQIARARNCGAAAASGDWFIFIDADSHPNPALMEDVAVEIERGRCIAGGSIVKLEGQYRKANLLASTWNLVSRAMRWVAGSFIFCEAKAFREVGGFSQELFASEEIDLSKRLKKLARARGKKVVILHRHPLITSARKIHLYTAREHAAFMLRTILAGGRTLTSREACHTWYDGRR